MYFILLLLMISFSRKYSYVTKTLLKVTEPNKLREYVL